LPLGVERTHGLDGVEHDPNAARQGHIDVRLAVGIGWDVESELTVEGEGTAHVFDHDPERVELWVLTHEHRDAPAP
jgi:hypothetical protein